MNLYHRKQAGFTLIELVIVILGILAAVAAPRFINTSTDVRVSALESLSGAIRSASNLVLAQANIDGAANDASGIIDTDNDGVGDVNVAFGYPLGDRSTGIANVLDLADDWAIGDNNGGNGGTSVFITSSFLAGFSGITNNNIPITSTVCFLTYTPLTTQGIAPTITLTITGC